MFLYDKTFKTYQNISGDDPDLVRRLPSGVYIATVRRSDIVFDVAETSGDVLVDVNTVQSRQLSKEISDFFDGFIALRLQSCGISHRRGVILYGEPGSGKTSLVRSFIPTIIDKNAIVLLDPNPGYFPHFARAIRDDDPDRRIVIIWDDCDRIMRGSSGSVIEVMDGMDSPDHILALCTTNHIDKISRQITARPTRFGLIMEIPRLDPDSRIAYVRNKFSQIPDDVAMFLVDITADHELDHLQEVCKLHLMGYSNAEICARMAIAWRDLNGGNINQDNSNDDDDIFDMDIVTPVIEIQ